MPVIALNLTDTETREWIATGKAPWWAAQAVETQSRLGTFGVSTVTLNLTDDETRDWIATGHAPWWAAQAVETQSRLGQPEHVV